MKVIITDPQGVARGGARLKCGEEHDVPKGPHLDAWLRFGQAKEVKGRPAKADKDNEEPKAKSKPDEKPEKDGKK